MVSIQKKVQMNKSESILPLVGIIIGIISLVPVNKSPQVVVERFGPPSQVRLTWKPLSNREARGKIILYKLQWRSADSEFSNVRYIDGNSQEFVITGKLSIYQD